MHGLVCVHQFDSLHKANVLWIVVASIEIRFAFTQSPAFRWSCKLLKAALMRWVLKLIFFCFFLGRKFFSINRCRSISFIHSIMRTPTSAVSIEHSNSFEIPNVQIITRTIQSNYSSFAVVSFCTSPSFVCTKLPNVAKVVWFCSVVTFNAPTKIHSNQILGFFLFGNCHCMAAIAVSWPWQMLTISIELWLKHFDSMKRCRHCWV